MLKELGRVSGTIINPAIEDWKRQGKKTIGFVCSYVPEEIIHAAGAMPYRVRATGCGKTPWGDVWMSNFSCSFARACLELALDGTYDFLDGLVAPDGCAQMHKLYDNWRFNAARPFMHMLAVPHKTTDNAVALFRDELAALKERLEDFAGSEITDRDLRSSVETYNETRRLLRELYRLRESTSPPITGAQSQSAVLAATSMPRQGYNEFLRQALDEIRRQEPTQDYRARLMIIGSALEDPALINIIEGRGGLVVTDALCFGSRYFWEPVEPGTDILLSLARSYLRRPNCPRMMDQHQAIFDFIRDMVRQFNVDGIIYQKMQFCDLWGGESLFLENKLREAGIPFLPLQREHSVANIGQVATRVEAFIEMLKGVAG